MNFTGLDITEALTEKEGITLQNIARDNLKEGSIAIEIGSWKGHSSAFIGEITKEKQAHLYCIDHWLGTEGVFHHNLVKDCFLIFRENINKLGLMDNVSPMIMSSESANSIVSDNIADMIFIDADHRYKYARWDIEHWYNKLKVGGVLCGHDCEKKYTDYSQKEQIIIDNHLVEDYNNEVKCHTGIVKALDEIFGNDYSIIPNTRIWIKIKE